MKQNGGKCLGLSVKYEHARKFFAEEDARKVFELRSQKVNFLKVGDRLAIVSTQSHHGRQCLGIVEFQGCTKINYKDFDRFAPFHRCSKLDFDKLKTKWTQNSFLWAWHLDAVHTFDPPLEMSSAQKGPEVWIYFDPNTLVSVQTPDDSIIQTPTPQSSHKRALSLSDMASTEESYSKRGKETSKTSTTTEGETRSDEHLKHDLTGTQDPGSEDEDGSYRHGDVSCLLMSSNEWECLLKGSKSIARAFPTPAGTQVHAIARQKTDGAWYFSGVFTLQECHQATQSELKPNEMYSREERQRQKQWSHMDVQSL